MKKVWFILAMMISVFASCSDGGSDNPVNPTPKPEEVKTEITIDSGIVSNGLSFGATEGEQSISISVNANWTLSVASTTSGVTWCKASATSGGKGSATVKFTVDENTGYDDRSVSVTIKAGSVSKTFTITQKGADALLVTTTKYEVAQEGGQIEIEVKTNISYQMEIAENAKSWITEVESKGRALTTNKHKLDITMNEDTEKREGEITFKSGDKVETVKVYQAGGAILLLSQNEYNVSDKGDTISIDIKSNIDFGVQMPDVDWIIDEASSRGLSSHTLKYIVSANEEYDSRSAEIIFYDKNSDLKDTLKVVQAQKDAIILSEKEISVEAEGETIEVKLSTNVDFEIIMPEVDWIKKVESRSLVEHSVYFKVEVNGNNEAREAEIMFVNKNSRISETLKITQKRKETGLELPEGFSFNSIVGNVLVNNSELKKIRFIANSDKTSETILVTDNNGSIGYIVANKEWLEIHTSAEYFVANKICSNMFAGKYKEYSPFNHIIEIDFGKCFNTSKVTEMTQMFFHCSSLTILDITTFNTSNVTRMTNMFGDCSALTTLNVSNFNTENVTDMSLMFDECSSLTALDVINFNTENVTRMCQMFFHCNSLTTLDVTTFKTENVTDMSRMFSGCSKLTSLDVTTFKTENVTDMSGMFSGCSKLTSLDVTTFKTENVTEMANMFGGCSGLTSLDVTTFNTKNVTDMSGMFRDCSGLTSLDVTTFNTENATDMGGMFSGCSGLTSLDVTTFNTENVTDMVGMFNGCSGLTSLDVTTFNTKNVTFMSNMFEDCSNLTTLDVTNFNTENVTDMGGMFSGCCNLTTLDVTTFKTENVTIMGGMFDGCSNLTTLDVTTFNTENVTNMVVMFRDCRGLTSLDVTTFNTENVTEMSGMFSGCSGLTTLDVTTFNTENVTEMADIFSGCSGLSTLDVTAFKTENVTDMGGMFNGCSSLTTLDVTTFNTENVTIMSYMFKDCSNLTTLDVTNFITEKVSYMDRMFSGCSNLTALDLSSFLFNNNVIARWMFEDVGKNAINKPIPIKVTEEAYSYLKSAGIIFYGDHARFVKPDGTDW